MQRYDIVLMDADYTIFDFGAAEEQALSTVLGPQGYTLDPDQLAVYHAINLDLWAQFDRGEVTREWLCEARFPLFARAVNGPALDGAACNAQFQALLAQYACLLPEADVLCRTLARSCQLHLVTNGMAASQEGRLAKVGLRECFGSLFVSQTMNTQKPEAAFFHQVFDALHLEQADLARVVIVGDSLVSDIQGGINAGIDSIWFNPQGNTRNGGPCPTWECARLSQVAEIVLGCTPGKFA